MRKIIAIILLCAILVSAISGCGNSGNDGVAAYIDMAQGFIDNGDYEAAMDVLQKGYTATSDERLAVMIAECMTALSGATTESSAQDDPTQTTVPTTSATEPTTIDLSLFEGSWAEENIGWLNGGMILDVFPNGDGADICLNLVEEAPYNSIAEAWIDIESSNITNGKFSAEFEDSWGTTGTVHLCFTTESIICEITDISFPEDTWWGMYEGSFTLFLNNDAYDALDYTMEEFYEEFPELNPENQEPTYDMSKASGILAEAGLSEQEFRDICEPLEESSYVARYGSITGPEVGRLDRYHVAYGMQYYTDNPEDDDVQIAIDKWDKICADYESGGDTYTGSYGYGNYSHYHYFSKYQDLDTYLLHTVYAPKGVKILVDNTEELFERMKEYPNDYLGKAYVLLDFEFDIMSGTTYVDSNYNSVIVSVNDLRDDVNNPNVLKENEYYLYVIFEGTYTEYNGDIGLLFSLLSLEKCE